MCEDETTDIRARLIALRSALEASGGETREDRKPVALDQQSVGRLSRMDAMQQQAMAQAEERRRAIERQRIDLALERLGAGEYGFCTDCGEPIAEKRLALDPCAAKCIDCARG